MAGIDPYAPCPCGSGEKFKWCCQKVETYADRADRLYEGGQFEAAVAALDEGLKKNPDNPLLSYNKAVYQIRERKPEDAAETLRRLLRAQPNHVDARILLARAVVQTEGPTSSSAHIQNALGLAEGESRRKLAALYRMVGIVFSRMGHFPAAIKHLDQADELDPESAMETESAGQTSASIRINPGVIPPLKSNYALAKAPAGLAPDLAARFDDALAWAEAGAWNSAAAAFEMLSGEAGPEADRNLGLLRLWTGEDRAAAQAMERAVSKLGETPDAVDLEMLCQVIEPPVSEDKLERVQLIWPLKNRDALLDKLRALPDVVDDGPGPIDDNDPKSPEVQHFLLLDRPALPAQDGKALKPADLPRITATAFVGKEIAGVETVDDGKLNVYIDRFTSIAVPAIPPSHPKTKVVGTVHRLALALSWEWHYPEEILQREADRLRDEEQARIIREVWPKTKIRTLGQRTPIEAAKAGDAGVALRAMLNIFECQTEGSLAPIDFGDLKAQLGVAPEPEVDPEHVDFATLPYFRYRFVPVDRLSDEALVEFYFKCRGAGLRRSQAAAALRLVDRSDLRKANDLGEMMVFGDLAFDAASLGRVEEALAWLGKGREAAGVKSAGSDAAAWDMFEIRMRTECEPPETWVPQLAAVLERHGDDRQADQAILVSLVSMGLMQVSPSPDRQGQILLDSRPLQMLLAEYGPKITTASGRLGVSATKPEVWTPESAKGGTTTPGGIWTPGSSGDKGGGGDKPKLIIPGR